MNQFETRLLALIFCFFAMGSQAHAKALVRKAQAPAKAVRVLPPAAFASTTGQHQTSQINFNGLIDQSGRSKARLARRVAVKTATREDKANSHSHTATMKIDDEGNSVKFKSKAMPNALTAPSMRAPQSLSQPIKLEMVKLKPAF